MGEINATKLAIVALAALAGAIVVRKLKLDLMLAAA